MSKAGSHSAVTSSNDFSFLRSSIHTNLLLRLLLAASLVSIVLGIVAFSLEMQRLGKLVNKRASEVADNFNSEVKDILSSYSPSEEALLRSKLKVLSSVGNLSLGMGNVIYSGIYTPAGKPIVIEKDKDIQYMPTIEKIMESRQNNLMSLQDEVYELNFIHNTPHILLTFPLFNGKDREVAVLSGVFAVSLAARNQVFWRLSKIILQTIGVVLITTIILYPLILTLMNRLSGSATRLLESNIETLRVLGSAIAQRDGDTDIHNYRVTIYSVYIAEVTGLDNGMMRALIKGAFLHDVGKIGISDNILLKPGKLTDDEFGAMKQHVAFGIDIVKQSDWLKDAVDVVSCHHEKFAGKGYPHGIEKDAIPLNARIFAIADVFDALTSKRPYKQPLPFEKAMQILKEGRGIHFDPDLLDNFMTIAEPVYKEFASGSDQFLREKLEAITRKYFSEELYKQL